MDFSEEIIKEWLDIVNDDPRYCFFNTPYWYNIHAQYHNQPCIIKRKYKEGSTFLIPTFKRKIFGIIPIYNSSALGTYGNLISREADLMKSELVWVKKILRSRNFDYVGSPFLFSNLESKRNFTQIVELQRFQRKEITTNHLSSIAKAKKRNLEISEAVKISEWKEYFLVYNEVTKMRGEGASNNYSWNLFALIHKLPKSLRKLWVIKENGEILGGAICFYFNMVTYWHGANSVRCKKVGGSHLLHECVISDAQERGFEIYDLNPSGGHEGVVKFKAGFNAKKRYFIKVEHRNKLFTILLKAYKAFK